jgi:hypothetical protein
MLYICYTLKVGVVEIGELAVRVASSEVAEVILTFVF